MGGEWWAERRWSWNVGRSSSRPVLAGMIGAVANIGYMLAVVLVKGVEALGTGMDGGGCALGVGAVPFPLSLRFCCGCLARIGKMATRGGVGPRPRLAEIFAPARIRAHTSSDVAERHCRGRHLGLGAMDSDLDSEQHWQPGLASDVQISAQFGGRARGSAGAGAGKYFGRREVYFVFCLGSLLICGYLFRIHPKHSEGVDFLFLVVVFLTGGFTASFYGWLPLYLPEMFPTRMQATGRALASILAGSSPQQDRSTRTGGHRRGQWRNRFSEVQVLGDIRNEAT